MRPTLKRTHIAVVGLFVMGCNTAAGAQSNLERSIAANGDGPVQFAFASRDGVCGNGRSFYRVDDDGWYSVSTTSGTFTTSTGMRSDACERGPVRVVVTRAGRDVVKVETFAGPLTPDAEAGRNLGIVSAREAVQYLLSIAGSTEGRPAREAITPAMLGDSAVVAGPLLAIAKDKSRSRMVRRTAMSSASRRRSEPGGIGAAAVARALNEIVRDREEGEPIRQQALSTISSLDRGEGIPVLIGFADDGDEWIASQSIKTLARSGDPRARAFTRDLIKSKNLPEGVSTEVIRGLGGDYATAADYRLLRDLYPSLNNDRDRDAIISTLASAGGRENADWLLTLAKSPTETVARRRRVINALAKFDDPRVRAALKELIVK